jgi:hypothetical protein
MKTSATFSEEVPTKRWPKKHVRQPEPGSALPVIAALSLAVFMTSCGKSTPEPQVVAPAPSAPAAAPVSNINVEAEIANALTGTAPAPLAASDLEREAESIMAKYPTLTATDLLNVPEVQTKLRTLLGRLAQDKALQDRINSSVDLAGQIKGLEGATKLDLDMKSYDRPRTSRMLQAALSEDPKQLVAFLVGEIGEAAPDISFGGLERAPNGVSIVPNPAATPTPAAITPPKTDFPD